MRRILLLVALAASLLTAAPAAAGPPPAARAWLSGQAAALEAAGFALAWHSDGTFTGNKGWYNPANGRIYAFHVDIDVTHDSVAGEWYPEVAFWCKRSYGTLTVDSLCDFHGTFKAVVSPNGSSVSSVGSRALRDVNGDHSTLCKYRILDQGAIRSYGSSYPWAMSYVENLEVDFLAAGCIHVHTTRTYDVGSYLVNLQDHRVVNHDLTGFAG